MSRLFKMISYSDLHLEKPILLGGFLLCACTQCNAPGTAGNSIAVYHWLPKLALQIDLHQHNKGTILSATFIAIST